MDLKERIERYSLTRERVELVLGIKIKEIRFKPLISSGYIVPAPKTDFDTEFGKYIILINSSDSEEEQKITLIHEIAHICYELMGTNTKFYTGRLDLLLEELLENEAKRFYTQNRDFVEKIYEKVNRQARQLSRSARTFPLS